MWLVIDWTMSCIFDLQNLIPLNSGFAFAYFCVKCEELSFFEFSMLEVTQHKDLDKSTPSFQAPTTHPPLMAFSGNQYVELFRGSLSEFCQGVPGWQIFFVEMPNPIDAANVETHPRYNGNYPRSTVVDTTMMILLWLFKIIYDIRIPVEEGDFPRSVCSNLF